MSYGCHNRESFRPTVEVQDGWIETIYNGMLCRVPRMVILPDPMTRHCNYTKTELGQADTKCFGCDHREEEP